MSDHAAAMNDDPYRAQALGARRPVSLRRHSPVPVPPRCSAAGTPSQLPTKDTQPPFAPAVGLMTLPITQRTFGTGPYYKDVF